MYTNRNSGELDINVKCQIRVLVQIFMQPSHYCLAYLFGSVGCEVNFKILSICSIYPHCMNAHIKVPRDL